ncbi:MAG: YjjG family noncanonical pyrimidine nucleotidase [Spirochaetales bacterium]|nr:YjjG family noncanonical pyrimidine nucleotidase [Spirochaetales bacterium]
MKIGKKKYYGFLIDADNTLFDFDRAEQEAFLSVFRNVHYSGSLDKAYRQFSFINKNLWKLFEKKKISIKAIRKERFVILLKSLKIKEDPDKLALLFIEELSVKPYLFPHAKEVLEYLSGRALLCLITNGIASVQRGRLAGAGIEKFFQSIIISEEIGYSKPDPAFFKKATADMHLPQFTILCVGDSPSSDIEGGNLAGFDTCWYMHVARMYPPNRLKPDYIISDLNGLKEFAPEIY